MQPFQSCMTQRGRRPGRASVLACFAVSLALGSGCKPAEQPSSGKGTATEAARSRPPVTDREIKPGSTPAPEKSAEVLSRPEPAAVTSLKSAADVLAAMCKAYRQATSYADKGTVRIRAVQGGEKIDRSVDYSLVTVRPNKIRLQVFEAVVVSDGRQLIAFANDLPDQIAKRSAPATIDIKTIFADRILGSAISQGPTQGFSWVPLSLLLMVADDPLKTILFRSAPPVLLEPAKIDEHECYRVQLVRPDGVAVLWIDQRSLVLRRMAFPIEEMARSAGVENASLTAEFQEAGLNDQIDEAHFRHEVSARAHVGEWLLPPPLLLLGKPTPQSAFVGADGKPIDPKSLADKVAVIDFWATWCKPCRVSLPITEKLYKKYKDNPKVRFLAVSVDDPKTADKEVKAVLDELNITIPLARDPEQHAFKRFGVQGIPTMCVLGSNNVVQDFETGYRPTLEAELSAKIDKLLAGEDVYRDQLDRFETQGKEYAVWLDKWVEKGVFTGPAAEEQEVPEAKIAPRTEPKAFALDPLWKCTELKSPGNMLVVPGPGGAPKVFVLDSWKSVAEIGAGGKVVATHSLDLPEREAATLIRSDTGADGKRYYAVSGIMQQQVHLFDENWKKVLTFPEDALKNPHAGIADVQFADLNDDGKLELLVSYFQDVGVHCVAFDGKRIWANRDVAMVSRIAVWNAEPKGPRNVLCTNSLGSLAILDSQGKRRGEISIPNRLVHWVVSADLLGDQRRQLSGLYLAELGLSVVIGIDPKGMESWSFPLTKGVHRRPVEQIVVGNLRAGGPGQWIVPGPDGSVLVIAADGKTVDRWQTGSVITGLATMTAEGQPALVVALGDSVEAWRVKWPAAQK